DLFGFDVYSYNAAINFAVSAGTTYWLVIYSNTINEADNWFWSLRDGGGGNALFSENLSSWRTNVIGEHDFELSFPNSTPCTVTAMDDIEVLDLPTVTFNNTTDFLCLGASVQNVPLGGGLPVGGVYSGPGVTDAGNGTEFFFDPTVATIGRADIIYTFTDANGCTSADTSFIDVDDCQVQISDPCGCLDNATPFDVNAGTGGDDGQFAEMVRINGFNGAGLNSNQTWSVVGGSGGLDAFFQSSQGQQTPGNPIPTDGSQTLVPFNAGYILNFYHYDEAGYTIEIEGPYTVGDPRNQTLSISNICQYPNPVFDPALSMEEICQTDPVIQLGGTDINGNDASSVTFTIDGNAATEFDPAALGNGSYTVEMVYTDQGDANTGISPDGGTTPSAPGCVQTVRQVVMVGNAPPVITCPVDDFGLPPGCNPTVPDATTSFNIAGDPNPDLALPTVAEGCGDVMITSSDSISDNGCTRTVTRTYRATDQNGDFDECDQTFTFTFDEEDPTFVEALPADVTVECDAVPAAALLTATDNCTSIEEVLFINELHYDNTGTDVGEFVEIAGTAGIDLADYEIYAYEGFDGDFDEVVQLSGIIPDEGNGFGALAFTRTELPTGFFENGPNDGIALVEIANGTVVDFISYEGTVTATDGPGSGMTSTDIGEESANTAIGESLQRTGTGCDAASFTTGGPSADSPGLLNTGQIFDLSLCPTTNSVLVLFTEMRTDGSCANEYTLTREWTTTDACNNSISHTQTITVEDNTPSTFVEELPMDLVLECDETVPTATTLTAIIDCGQ
ncbi:MAG: hypothetical protein AAFY91_13085, partial [Bacteroidota bacterium]